MIPDGLGILDLVAGSIGAVFALYGAWKGIARLVIGFAGIALGWILAVRHAEALAEWIGAPPIARDTVWDPIRIAAFLILFLATVLASGVVAWIVTRFLGAVNLRWLDRLAGAGLGLLLALIFLCAATIPLMALLPADGRLVRQSRGLPYAVAGGDYLKRLAPEPLRSRFVNGARRVFEAARDASESSREAAAR